MPRYCVERAFLSEKQRYKNAYLLDPLQEEFLQQLLEADVAFLILHGRHGEDGKIQGFLETAGIPYIGSGVFASAIGMDKRYFKLLIQRREIRTPDFEILDSLPLTAKCLNSIMTKLGLPLFLKPISEGGSLGSSVIHSKVQLVNTITDFSRQGFDGFLVERYIKGRALTVGVLEINKMLVVLPVLETISRNEFYDYEAKHDPTLHRYKCPARVSVSLTKKIHEIATEVYRITGCYGFCRVDLILGEEDTIYVLEVNTLPGMSLGGNLATMAKAADVAYDDLVVHMLRTALRRPAYLP